MRFDTGSNVLTTCFLVFATSDAIADTSHYINDLVAVLDTEELYALSKRYEDDANI